jgi:hypothetical protein
MIPAILRDAQKVYDSWNPEDGYDEEYGEGGICHDIADAIVGVLSSHGVEASSVSQQIEEVHVYVVAKFKEGVYRVDIPPGTYERGSAYRWSKIDGVKFDANDIQIQIIDKNSENFEQYLECDLKMGFKEWMIVRRNWPFLSGKISEPRACQALNKKKERRRH